MSGNGRKNIAPLWYMNLDTKLYSLCWVEPSHCLTVFSFYYIGHDDHRNGLRDFFFFFLNQVRKKKKIKRLRSKKKKKVHGNMRARKSLFSEVNFLLKCLSCSRSSDESRSIKTGPLQLKWAEGGSAWKRDPVKAASWLSSFPPPPLPPPPAAAAKRSKPQTQGEAESITELQFRKAIFLASAFLFRAMCDVS